MILPSKHALLGYCLLLSSLVQAKEIALTFDDAPVGYTVYFETHERTNELIKKLKALNFPPVIIFANPCKRDDSNSITEQLKAYTVAGHIIGNHTCSNGV